MLQRFAFAALVVLIHQNVLVVHGQEATVPPTEDLSKVSLLATSEPQPLTISAPIIESREASGLLVMTLLGSALAVMGGLGGLAGNAAAESANARIDYEPAAVTYAKNVAAFEDRVEKRIRNGVSSVRHSAKKASRYLRNGIRRTASIGFGAVGRGASGIARIGDRAMRTFARATTNGLRRLSGATVYGVGRMGNGAGSGIARVGTAARRGLFRMTDAYARSLSRAGKGILGVGTAASSGLGRVAKTYMRGISRIGTVANRATSRIGSASYVSKRMGEIAAEGVSRVAEVVTAVPAQISNRISSLAEDKKLKDCLMQTMCYVGSPFFEADIEKRKRMMRSLSMSVGDEETLDSAEDIISQQDTINTNDITDSDVDFSRDDCDLFKCELASLGRRAYDLVVELRQANNNNNNNIDISQQQR